MLVMQMRIAIERGKGLPTPSLHCSQPSGKPDNKFSNVCGVRSKTSMASVNLKFIGQLFPVILGKILFPIPSMRCASFWCTFAVYRVFTDLCYIEIGLGEGEAEAQYGSLRSESVYYTLHWRE